MAEKKNNIIEKTSRIKKKRKKHSIFLRVFITAFLCAVGIGTYDRVQEYQRLMDEQMVIATQIEEEQQKKIEFQNKKEYYTSDSYVEQIARDQLGMVKPNEVLYVNRAE